MTSPLRLLLAFCLAWALCAPALAQKPSQVGIVLLHGLGGSGSSMATLAHALRDKGYLVSSPDMPWSAMRLHDVPVAAAEKMVLDELQALRSKGAQRIFLAGFSKGGLFAAYVSTRTRVDGLIAIAPNGASNTSVHAQALEQARAYIAQGKGDERVMLDQYWPTADRTYPTAAVPSAFVTWFDPDGAMSAPRIYGNLPPGMPILLVVPTRDFDNLLRAKERIFAAFPPHRLHRLYEPDSNHIGAVNACTGEVVRWVGLVLRGEKAPSR